MKRLVKRELKVNARKAQKQHSQVIMEIDRVFDEKEDPGLVLPGGAESLEIKRK